MQRKIDSSDPRAMFSPQGSAASALVAALFAHPAPTASVSELAATSKVATATAARTVQRLVEAGLVIDERAGRERLLRWNPDSFYARSIQDLLWVSHGALYRRPTDRSPLGHPTQWGWLEVKDWEVKGLIPQCLQASAWGAQAPASTTPDEGGPPAEQVRALVLELRDLPLPLNNGPWLQEAYGRWKIGHDNDAIHSELHQGAGLRQAISVLREATRAQPASATIAPSVWAHAIYALNAEATVATMIGERALILIEDAEKERATERDLRDAVREVLGRERRRAQAGAPGSDHQPDPWPPVEHIPPAVRRAREDPGASYERVLLAQCEATAQIMSARAVAMSAHLSFAAWLQANPAGPQCPHPVLAS